MKYFEIAGYLTNRDWEELKMKLKENEDELWGVAFNFFEQRITTRYINPINSILDTDLNVGEGFAVVNLQCSLIETIECFYQGWIYKHPNFYKNNKKLKISSEQIFISFFREREPIKSARINGKAFYKNIRCALLHETQTKNGWIIAENKKKLVIHETKDEKEIIYRSNFQKAILKVVESYKENIINGKANNAAELRKNFIAKIDHICSIS